jgi:branched-chain amino acid aminotransferase
VVTQGGRILTPPGSSSILTGITRNTVITLAAEMGMPVIEQTIAREQLYAAEEIFMTGTAAEVTPVRVVDHMTIGSGGCGPITRKIQDAFFGLFSGKTEDKWNWLRAI